MRVAFRGQAFPLWHRSVDPNDAHDRGCGILVRGGVPAAVGVCSQLRLGGVLQGAVARPRGAAHAHAHLCAVFVQNVAKSVTNLPRTISGCSFGVIPRSVKLFLSNASFLDESVYLSLNAETANFPSSAST